MTNVGDSATGVDACAGGWVAVTLRPSVAGAPSAPLTATVAVAPTLDRLQLGGVVGIDMPLGLLADGWRVADVLARRALGRRGVTVFAIPPRPVWQQATYAAANNACRELIGPPAASLPSRPSPSPAPNSTPTTAPRSRSGTSCQPPWHLGTSHLGT